MVFKIIYSDLVDLWISFNKKERIAVLYSFIKEKIGEQSFDEKSMRLKVYRFNNEMSKKWKETSYKKERLNLHYPAWMQWTIFSNEENDNVCYVLNYIICTVEFILK